MSKQESVGNWMELAKVYDKIEKETVEPYFIVTIEDRTTNEVLHRYDLPRYMFWKYDWVIRWRMSKFHCQRPRNNIVHFISFYDKKTGLEYGFSSLLSQLTSAKAKITILENRGREYMESNQNQLFFDESTDPILAKLRCKIASYEQKRDELEQLIKEKVEQVQKESGETPRPVCGSTVD